MVIKAAAWQQHEGGLPAPDTNQLHQLVGGDVRRHAGVDCAARRITSFHPAYGVS
jgi:hypothetical protein